MTEPDPHHEAGEPMSGETPAAEAESPSTPKAAEPAEPAEPEWKRRKRMAAVFGDGGLPQVSAEERAREGGDRSGTPDDWFRSQVPPHHG
ncbi:hypothetical protein [Nocardioides sp. AE5]|uniref:hypothetical protein n=1 Tax=Nocardioides sp. AE5 TaxID=2962573 RepID=UPI00288278E5|nr:hypothetical protein [Nocardioides sp. AE5]MDT0203113.1 hypothetical protein [Nocardioides sp. AE5]